ncbi:MAG: hypothetical protein RMJ39_10520 [Deltaproteobacteria bacterium]|nr:hypothetical protein [Deltaproteobacteria bacterium]
MIVKTKITIQNPDGTPYNGVPELPELYLNISGRKFYQKSGRTGVKLWGSTPDGKFVLIRIFDAKDDQHKVIDED